MGYKKAVEILPQKLLAELQNFVDGEYLYIPRKAENKKSWGEVKQSKKVLFCRNKEIFRKYSNGYSVHDLAASYFLSVKAIYKIIASGKRLI